jgi:endonuclease G
MPIKLKIATLSLLAITFVGLGGASAQTTTGSPSSTGPIPPTATATPTPPTISATSPLNCAASLYDGQAPTITRAALSKNTTELCYPSYAVLQSGLIKGPVWTAEHITAADVLAAQKIIDRGTYQIDPNIPTSDQGNMADYGAANFDKGRMASADGGSSPTDRNDRSTLANVLPLTKDLNRGVWHAIEHAVRDLAQNDNSIYVVTGPDFHGQKITTIKPSDILIPTSIWKAIYDPAKQSTGVYVCTNQGHPVCHVLSILDLTAETGIDPFPSVPAYEKTTAMTLAEPDAGEPGPQ